jgi:hypothetical protein
MTAGKSAKQNRRKSAKFLNFVFVSRIFTFFCFGCRNIGLLGSSGAGRLVEEEGVQADQAAGLQGVCAQMTGLVKQQRRMCNESQETIQ